MGIEQLLAAYSEGVKTFPQNWHDLGCGLDHLSRVPITGIMLVGTAGVAGMFAGQSISTSIFASLSRLPALIISPTQTPTGLSKSLLVPLRLAPLSWQLDLSLALLQGEVSEENLLVVLAEKHLGVKPTDSRSRVSVSSMSSFDGGS